MLLKAKYVVWKTRTEPGNSFVATLRKDTGLRSAMQTLKVRETVRKDWPAEAGSDQGKASFAIDRIAQNQFFQRT